MLRTPVTKCRRSDFDAVATRKAAATVRQRTVGGRKSCDYPHFLRRGTAGSESEGRTPLLPARRAQFRFGSLHAFQGNLLCQKQETVPSLPTKSAKRTASLRCGARNRCL